MPSTPDSDLYPTITYVDPLIMPLFIQTNNAWSIRNQCEGDWLLNSFIHKLNQEIVDDVKELVDHKETCVEIMSACRMYGWCVFQSYKQFDKVFTPLEKTDWIKEKNEETGKLDRIGIKVKWTDDLQNTYEDELYFDDIVTTNEDSDEPADVDDTDADTESDQTPSDITKDSRQKNPNVIGKAVLFIWRNGNGQPLQNCTADSAFAFADLDLSVLSLAIQIRQIQHTLAFSATTPFFYHLKYGDAITPTQRNQIIAQMGYVSASKGIGVKESILKEILPIENGSIEKCQAALDTLVSFFAATTRLPLSFYFGEKQIGSGLDGGKAESADDDRIMRKKEYILQHFAVGLSEIASTYWGIQLPDLNGFYEAKREEQKAEQEKQMEMEMKQKGDVKSE